MSFIIGRGRYARESYPQSPGAGSGAAPARAWADNSAGNVPLPAATRENLVSITVTPKKSGVFRLIGTGCVQDTSAAPNNFTPGFSQGNGPPSVNIYSAASPFVDIPASGQVGYALDVQTDQGVINLPPFPLGVPVQFNFVGSTGVGNGNVPSSGAQFDVQEI